MSQRKVTVFLALVLLSACACPSANSSFRKEIASRVWQARLEALEDELSGMGADRSQVQISFFSSLTGLPVLPQEGGLGQQEVLVSVMEWGGQDGRHLRVVLAECWLGADADTSGRGRDEELLEAVWKARMRVLWDEIEAEGERSAGTDTPFARQIQFLHDLTGVYSNTQTTLGVFPTEELKEETLPKWQSWFGENRGRLVVDLTSCPLEPNGL